MKKIDKAPEKGKMLALYLDKEPDYRDYVLSALEIEEDKLLELHLYDDKKEYRAMKSSVKGRFIESIIEDSSVKYDEVYEESVYLLNKDKPDEQKNLSKKVKIVNYIQYNKDNDMMSITNYRLSTE